MGMKKKMMSWRALRAADSHDILTQRTSHVTSPCETKSTLNPTSKTRTTTLYSATCTTTQWFLSSPPHHFNGILLFVCLWLSSLFWLVSSPNFYALIVFLGLMPIIGIAVPVHTDASHDLSPTAVLSKPCFQPRTVKLL